MTISKKSKRLLLTFLNDLNHCNDDMSIFIKEKLKIETENYNEIYLEILPECENQNYCDFYGKLLIKELNQPKGVVFTPQVFADFLIDQFIELPEQPGFKFLDLGAGIGNFYFAMIRKIQEKLENEKRWTVKDIILNLKTIYSVELIEEFVIFQKIRAYFFFRKFFTQKEVFQIFEALVIYQHDVFSEIEVTTLTKTLVSNPTLSPKFFDFIISNPPYIGYRHISKSQKLYFKKNFASIYTGLNDISYYFFAHSLKLLKKEGKVVILTSRYFMEARYAKLLREILLKNTICTIIDIPNSNIFGKGINSVIIEIQKSKPLRTHAIKLKLIRKQKKQHDIIVGILHLPERKKLQAEFSGEVWNILTEKEEEIIKFLNLDSLPLNDIAKIGTGFHTGLDEVFIANIEKREEQYYGKVAGKQDYELESSLIKKIIKTTDILPYIVNFNDRYFLSVYRKNKIADYPKIRQYLENFRQRLENRYDCKKNGVKWYEIAQIRNQDIFDAKLKIVCPYRMVKPKFAIDLVGYYSSIDITMILPLKIDPYILVAYLNHPIVKQYILLTAKKLDGKKIELYPEYLRNLPIKKSLLVSNELLTQVQSNVKKIIHPENEESLSTFELQTQIDRTMSKILHVE
ncbi:Eco57I restriction-modification methylase domain-containing protein [Candidatus Lokiarchaeum ossiferum]|uniref:Eco57I restriction-modification methylase domain-containing protein n=1 Tax=Candidatus Lokiarchaeum ossiferum TaxID=2951803 RepID=UPI00352C9DA4